MAYGQRDSFAENVGDFLLDSDSADFSMDFGRATRRKRKTRKSRSMGSRTHKRRKVRHSRRKHSRKSHRAGRTHSKRKGMSKEFLRKLRKKHGLGEFKKR